MGENTLRIPDSGVLTGSLVRTLDKVVSGVTANIHFWNKDGMALKVASSTVSASVTYIGEALPGTLSATSGWRIKKIDESTGFAIITWSNGNDTLEQSWDLRQSASFS